MKEAQGSEFFVLKEIHVSIFIGALGNYVSRV